MSRRRRPTATARVCSACKGTGFVDPIGDLAAGVDREAAFIAAYPYLSCPACRKRVSPRYDSVDAMYGTKATVTMHCRRCDHRWEQPRVPKESS